ncbi:MAG: hypothetical protein A2Y81_07960 [Nitrospirae bacterium RBG_13_43_8]|nr:MAG: hypothetical protein A2Y81_07960 [Nitrospirae bacterium RBG_13_43_8]
MFVVGSTYVEPAVYPAKKRVPSFIKRGAGRLLIAFIDFIFRRPELVSGPRMNWFWMLKQVQHDTLYNAFTLNKKIGRIRNRQM